MVMVTFFATLYTTFPAPDDVMYHLINFGDDKNVTGFIQNDGDKKDHNEV